MLCDLDIWRAAHLMVQQHKDGAVKAAGERAAELESADDTEGRQVWRRIGAAIVDLQQELAEREPLN